MEDNLGMPIRELLPIMQDRLLKRSTYFGVPALKSPIDFWVYQEIIFEIQPDVIVELGTRFGGGTLALAHILDCMNRGKVISCDIVHDRVADAVRKHPRIILITGDACESLHAVKGRITRDDRVLIIEDSSHTYENTLNVLRAYGDAVTPGSYFIVEDGICHHGLDVGPKPGPYEAIEQFARENRAFEIDRSRESFCITWNPKGYLKRVR